MCNSVAVCCFFGLVSDLRQGKTWFLSYILARRLLARRPTVFRTRDKACFLFSERSMGKRVDADDLFAIDSSEKRQLWILTGEALTDPEWRRPDHQWFVLLAASPQKIQASRQWVKDRNPGVHYILNWEWHEIFAAYRYCAPLTLPELIC